MILKSLKRRIVPQKSDGGGVLEKFMGYWVRCEEDGSTNYVCGLVMHLARPDARTVCVTTTIDIEIKRGAGRQTLLPTLYGRRLRRAVASILEMSWEAVRNVRAA